MEFLLIMFEVKILSACQRVFTPEADEDSGWLRVCCAKRQLLFVARYDDERESVRAR